MRHLPDYKIQPIPIHFGDCSRYNSSDDADARSHLSCHQSNYFAEYFSLQMGWLEVNWEDCALMGSLNILEVTAPYYFERNMAAIDSNKAVRVIPAHLNLLRFSVLHFAGGICQERGDSSHKYFELAVSFL